MCTDLVVYIFMYLCIYVYMYICINKYSHIQFFQFCVLFQYYHCILCLYYQAICIFMTCLPRGRFLNLGLLRVSRRRFNLARVQGEL